MMKLTLDDELNGDKSYVCVSMSGYRTFNEFLYHEKLTEDMLTQTDIDNYLNNCLLEHKCVHPMFFEIIDLHHYGIYTDALKVKHLNNDFKYCLICEYNEYNDKCNDKVFRLKNIKNNDLPPKVSIHIRPEHYEDIVNSIKFRQIYKFYNYEIESISFSEKYNAYNVIFMPILAKNVINDIIENNNGIVYYMTNDDNEASLILKNGLYNRNVVDDIPDELKRTDFAYLQKIKLSIVKDISYKYVFKVDFNKIIDSYNLLSLHEASAFPYNGHDIDV